MTTRKHITGAVGRFAWGVLPTLFACRCAWGQVYFAPLPGQGTLQAPALEQVLDEPDMESVASLPTDSPIREAALSVGRLRIQVTVPGGSQAEAWCTGTLVAVDLMLTVNHCVPGRYGVRAISATLELKEPDAPNTNDVERFAVQIEPLETSVGFDYSLLRVPGRPGERFGHVQLAMQPAQQGDPVFIIHYPFGREQMVTRRNCRIHRSSQTNFIHSCDTMSGSSGAPVFSVSSGKVVGLHYAGSRDANYGKQIAALVDHSAALVRLDGVKREASGENIQSPDSQGMALARRGENEVAQQIEASLGQLAQSPLHEMPTSARPQRDGTKVPIEEPLIQWNR